MLSWILREASLVENSSEFTGDMEREKEQTELSCIQLSGPKSLGPGELRLKAVLYSILQSQVGPGQETYTLFWKGVYIHIHTNWLH